MNCETIRDGVLVLADGSVFEGELIGADVPVASGEVVFNTVMSGYQEVITDPSYAGPDHHVHHRPPRQLRRERRRLRVARHVLPRRRDPRTGPPPQQPPAEGGLDAMLVSHGVPGIAGIDTRRLTRIIRETGAIPGAFGPATEADLLAAARREPGTDGVDLVSTVTTPDRLHDRRARSRRTAGASSPSTSA